MKKLLKNVLFIGAIGSVGILASCGGDDEIVPPAQPSIEVAVSGLEDTNEPYEAVPGETVTFTITMDVPGTFNVLTVTTSVDGTAATPEDYPRGNAAITANAENTEASATLNYEFDADDVGSEYEFEFVVVDDSNQKATSTVTVTVISPEAKVQTAVLLYAPTVDENSDTFYSIALDSVYSVNDVEQTEGASGTVDLGYFYVTEANLASPSDYSSAFVGAYDISDWAERRSTNMVLTSLTSVEGISTVADVEAALAEIDFEADGATTVEGLEVNQIYAFETEDGLQGLIRVVSIEPGFNSDDFVELEFILAAGVEAEG